jgi:solute carrier family 35
MNLKNILVTYVGMYIGGDYYFSVNNFIGLLINTAASILYSYLSYKDMKANKEVIELVF